MEAILFVGHGSRRKTGNDQFINFIDKTFDQIDVPIKSYGFLENAQPSILQAIDDCVLKKATTITVVPVFLLPGIHANEDVPTELENAKRKYPEVFFRYGNPLGVHEILINILEERLRYKGFSKEGNDTVLLLGHGSREPIAQVEFEKMVSTLKDRGYSHGLASYLKIEPYYDKTISRLLENGNNRVFVVPHLLFANSLFEIVKQTISSLQATRQVILCDPTGFDKRIIDLLIYRVKETQVAPVRVWDGR
ncbi:sirohydrochlorin chelatase [Cytobacillus sp. FJAT-54145]|uniref:Sirohydrochlorin chelatase n=1 Tax=Cytobacillus spartinae TaxID=3299023 RepID=A0ABW6K8I2_9BACI